MPGENLEQQGFACAARRFSRRDCRHTKHKLSKLKDMGIPDFRRRKQQQEEQQNGCRHISVNSWTTPEGPAAVTSLQQCNTRPTQSAPTSLKTPPHPVLDAEVPTEPNYPDLHQSTEELLHAIATEQNHFPPEHYRFSFLISLTLGRRKLNTIRGSVQLFSGVVNRVSYSNHVNH